MTADNTPLASPAPTGEPTAELRRALEHALTVLRPLVGKRAVDVANRHGDLISQAEFDRLDAALSSSQSSPGITREQVEALDSYEFSIDSRDYAPRVVRETYTQKESPLGPVGDYLDRAAVLALFPSRGSALPIEPTPEQIDAAGTAAVHLIGKWQDADSIAERKAVRLEMGEAALRAALSAGGDK